MKYLKIDKDVLFFLMCEIDVDIMNAGYPISIPNCAELLKTSKYQVRKYMKELEKEGLVKSVCIYYDGRPDYETGELWDDARIMKGWELTEKGRQTEMRKERSKNMSRIIKEVWGD